MSIFFFLFLNVSCNSKKETNRYRDEIVKIEKLIIDNNIIKANYNFNQLFRKNKNEFKFEDCVTYFKIRLALKKSTKLILDHIKVKFGYILKDNLFLKTFESCIPQNDFVSAITKIDGSTYSSKVAHSNLLESKFIEKIEKHGFPKESCYLNDSKPLEMYQIDSFSIAIVHLYQNDKYTLNPYLYESCRDNVISTQNYFYLNRWSDFSNIYGSIFNNLLRSLDGSLIMKKPTKEELSFVNKNRMHLNLCSIKHELTLQQEILNGNNLFSHYPKIQIIDLKSFESIYEDIKLSEELLEEYQFYKFDYEYLNYLGE